MNKFALIFDFLGEGGAEVQGRSVQGAQLPSRETGLIDRVSSGEATEEERRQAVVLMRDNEEAMLHFAQLMARASSAEG